MEEGLPVGWVFAKLGDVSNINKKIENLSDYDQTMPVSFIPMKLINADKGIIENQEIRPLNKVRKGYTQFIDNDVLFAKITPCMENGKAAIARNLKNGIGFGSTEFHVIRPFPVLLPEYIYHYIRQEVFRNEAINHFTGSVGQKRVPKQFLLDKYIPLPPLNEQKRIAAKLDKIIPRIEVVRERLEKVPTIIKRFRQSVLTDAVTGKLTEKWREEHPDAERVEMYTLRDARNTITDMSSEYIMEEINDTWKWVNIGNIADVKGGKRIPKGEKLVKKNTGHPYIKAGNLKKGTVIDKNIEYVSTFVWQCIKRYIVNTGDVYITNVGACIGDAGIIPERFNNANITENAVKICNFSDFLFNEYLSLWLKSPICQGYIRNTILSAAQGKLALGRIKAIPLPLPPLEEQQEIVYQVNRLFAVADNIEAHYNKAKAKVKNLTQSVLAKTFRGELVPQDPDDEPAEKLLERIKEEKAKMEAELERSKTNRRKRKKK